MLMEIFSWAVCKGVIGLVCSAVGDAGREEGDRRVPGGSRQQHAAARRLLAAQRPHPAALETLRRGPLQQVRGKTRSASRDTRDTTSKASRELCHADFVK